MGFYDEAVFNQNKAINMTKLLLQQKNKITERTIELKKMKERRL